MFRKTTSMLTLMILVISVDVAQSSEWQVFDTTNSGLPSNEILSVGIANDGTKWIGTYDQGLASFDGLKWTVYDTSNSEIPSNYISSLAIDDEGIVWIGSGELYRPPGRLAAFDGSSWTVYDSSNSNSTFISVSDITIDWDDTKWIGTFDQGIVRFDGANWTGYNTSNSDIPNNRISSIELNGKGGAWIGAGDLLLYFDGSQFTQYADTIMGVHFHEIPSIAIDLDGVVWLSAQCYAATFGGGPGNLVSFDGVNWAAYSDSNSALPSKRVSSVTIDNNNGKWIGTGAGLAFFDDTNWVIYDTSNSGLPQNWINSISIDGNGNKWMGTYGGGLAVFNEGGIVVGTDEEQENQLQSSKFSLQQNHPNPFNPITTISYDLPELTDVNLTIFDVKGRKVATLLNTPRDAGTHKVQWNGLDDRGKQVSTGVYLARLQAGDFSKTIKMVYLK